MPLQNLLHDDRMEMLKWVSERNMHVPLSELAFMLDLNDESMAGCTETGSVLSDHPAV